MIDAAGTVLKSEIVDSTSNTTFTFIVENVNSASVKFINSRGTGTGGGLDVTSIVVE